MDILVANDASIVGQDCATLADYNNPGNLILTDGLVYQSNQYDFNMVSLWLLHLINKNIQYETLRSVSPKLNNSLHIASQVINLFDYSDSRGGKSDTSSNSRSKYLAIYICSIVFTYKNIFDGINSNTNLKYGIQLKKSDNKIVNLMNDLIKQPKMSEIKSMIKLVNGSLIDFAYSVIESISKNIILVLKKRFSVERDQTQSIIDDLKTHVVSSIP